MDLDTSALLFVVAVLVATAPVAAQNSVGVDADAQVSPNGTQVTVDSATIDQDGWIVIHPEGDEFTPEAGTVLGKEYIESGSHSDVQVNISKDLFVNQSLFAMLHYDDPADQNLTFSPDNGEDPPVEMVQPFETGERRYEGNVSVDHFFVIANLEDTELLRTAAEREDEATKVARKEALKQELEQQLQDDEDDGETETEQTQDDGNDSEDEQDDGEGSPGFAVVGALAALIATAALARRR